MILLIKISYNKIYTYDPDVKNVIEKILFKFSIVSLYWNFWSKKSIIISNILILLSCIPFIIWLFKFLIPLLCSNNVLVKNIFTEKNICDVTNLFNINIIIYIL